MTLQSSGTISLDQIHVEAGGTTETTASINDSDIRELIDKTASTQMSFSEWYGATATFSFSISSNTLKGTLSTLATAAGWDGNDLIDCTINSGVYVWSNSTSTAALTIDVADATVTNNGYIMGQGGRGGKNTSSASLSATDGGPAINVTASGTTITNNSGAYIAGGGGGGAWSAFRAGNGDDRYRGGGGGAGGGAGGAGDTSSSSLQAGATGPGLRGSGNISSGAEAGGGRYSSGTSSFGYGGGRILPGQAHDTSTNAPSYTSGGGAGGQAGTGGGGGGWGAAGSNGDSFGNTIYGGSGGAAITGTSRTFTNNGTVYGST